MTNHESGNRVMPNLTPSEIAEITRKANLLFPESPQGYIAAACEYAAEIKRLREGIEKIIMHTGTTWSIQRNLKQLLNSQP